MSGSWDTNSNDFTYPLAISPDAETSSSVFVKNPMILVRVNSLVLKSQLSTIPVPLPETEVTISSSPKSLSLTNAVIGPT